MLDSAFYAYARHTSSDEKIVSKDAVSDPT